MRRRKVEYDFLWREMEAGKTAIEAPFVKGLLRRLDVAIRDAAAEKAIRRSLQRKHRKLVTENSRLQARLAAVMEPIEFTLGHRVGGDRTKYFGAEDTVGIAQIGNQVLQLLDQLRSALPSLEQFHGYRSTWIKFTLATQIEDRRERLKLGSAQELRISLVIFLDLSVHDKSDMLGSCLTFSSAIDKLGIPILYQVTATGESAEGRALDYGYFPFHRVGPAFMIGVD